MRTRSALGWRAWLGQTLALCLVLVSVAGCLGLPMSSPSSPDSSAHVIAWVQQDASGIAQVWASIDDSSPTQITHRTGAAPGCGYDLLGSPMYAPDRRHIAVASGSTCGDGQITGPLFVVDAATGALSRVPLPGAGTVLTNQRSYGWIDDQTLFAVGSFGTDSGGIVYTLGGGAATALAGLPSNVPEAVARGSTLFYVTADQTTVGGYPAYHSVLGRYDLGARAVIPGAIDLGTFEMCKCPPGDYHLPGWDAAPDGMHIVYQVVKPDKPASATTGIASEAVYYAQADGSQATQIVHAMTTHSRVRMRLSPDGSMVGITEAHDTPDVLSGCVSTPGYYGEPCLQFYGPDASGYPAWHWDSAYMVATAAPSQPTLVGALYHYTPSRFHATLYAASGYNCWSSP